MPGPTVSAIRWTLAPDSRSPAALRAATSPPPTTRQRLSATTRFTGYCPASTTWATTVLAALVEAHYPKLDGKIDLAKQYVVGNGQDRGCHAENGANAGFQHP